MVHFWAAWCEPCKLLDQVLAQLAADAPAVAALRVEAEEAADISERYSVAVVPYFLFFRDGKVGVVLPARRLRMMRPALPRLCLPHPRYDAFFPLLPLTQVVDSLEGADAAALTSKFNALAAGGAGAAAAAAAPAPAPAPAAPSYVEPAAGGEQSGTCFLQSGLPVLVVRR